MSVPDPRYFATCSCGWKSAVRINPNDIIALAENHDERAHPYRRDFRQTEPMEVAR